MGPAVEDVENGTGKTRAWAAQVRNRGTSPVAAAPAPASDTARIALAPRGLVGRAVEIEHHQIDRFLSTASRRQGGPMCR